MKTAAAIAKKAAGPVTKVAEAVTRKAVAQPKSCATAAAKSNSNVSTNRKNSPPRVKTARTHDADLRPEPVLRSPSIQRKQVSLKTRAQVEEDRKYTQQYFAKDKNEYKRRKQHDSHNSHGSWYYNEKYKKY
jgi:hypothetical protein